MFYNFTLLIKFLIFHVSTYIADKLAIVMKLTGHKNLMKSTTLVTTQWTYGNWVKCIITLVYCNNYKITGIIIHTGIKL
jgi:hypothetical protein